MIDSLNMHYVVGGRLVTPLRTDGTYTPALVITNTLWRELYYLTHDVFHNIEYAVFLTMTRPSAVKQLWLATGMFMPTQTITRTNVDMDLDEVRKFVAEGKWHHRDLCHWHSHNTMCPEWSSTDLEQQTDRSELAYADNYRFYVVVSETGEYRCDCVTYDPFLQRKEGIAIYTTGVGEGFDKELTKERKEELKQMAEEKCTRPKEPVVQILDDWNKYYETIDDMQEEDCDGDYGLDVEPAGTANAGNR